MTQGSVRKMVSDNQIFFSFKTRGTPQYFQNMLLDVLAEIKQFDVYFFFLTCSAGESHWTEIIQIVARQYKETLNEEQVNIIDWSKRMIYLKRNSFILRGTEHVHSPIHVKNVPKIDNELVEFIDKHITCVLPDETRYPEIINSVKKVQIHHNRTTCRKKKCVAFTFNAPWAPSDETKIICSEEKMDETRVKNSQKH